MKDIMFLAVSKILHYFLDDICDKSFTNIPVYVWIEILCLGENKAHFQILKAVAKPLSSFYQGRTNYRIRKLLEKSHF